MPVTRCMSAVLIQGPSHRLQHQLDGSNSAFNDCDISRYANKDLQRTCQACPHNQVCHDHWMDLSVLCSICALALQLFMLVVVLPYELPESLASHIVVLLAETLVLLLGPASSWTSGRCIRAKDLLRITRAYMCTCPGGLPGAPEATLFVTTIECLGSVLYGHGSCRIFHFG